mmetsp:Transcript_35996/g.84369  ORF Transcript_35996/g.84369 Transcript_35996/m.84369 type:complete len:262 (-) Transcript_35996:1871-2656(-)
MNMRRSDDQLRRVRLGGGGSQTNCDNDPHLLSPRIGNSFSCQRREGLLLNCDFQLPKLSSDVGGDNPEKLPPLLCLLTKLQYDILLAQVDVREIDVVELPIATIVRPGVLVDADGGEYSEQEVQREVLEPIHKLLARLGNKDGFFCRIYQCLGIQFLQRDFPRILHVLLLDVLQVPCHNGAALELLHLLQQPLQMSRSVNHELLKPDILQALENSCRPIGYVVHAPSGLLFHKSAQRLGNRHFQRIQYGQSALRSLLQRHA